MGEYVGHIDFYGITVDWENIFEDYVLENEEIDLVDCIDGNEWKEYNLEKPYIFVLCKELKLDITVVCESDKVGYMHLGDRESTRIAIGQIITGSTIKERISSLYQTEINVTQRKINEIIEVLGLDDNYISTLRLESYYSQG